MTKQEFIKRVDSEKLNIGEYIIVTEGVTDEPLVLGCTFEQGMWKVYETRERGGHFIIKEFDSENEAFDYFYELVLTQHNYTINKF